jgi:hypothetical protein
MSGVSSPGIAKPKPGVFARKFVDATRARDREMEVPPHVRTRTALYLLQLSRALRIAMTVGNTRKNPRVPWKVTASASREDLLWYRGEKLTARPAIGGAFCDG